MKKIVSVILAALLVLSFAGCSKKAKTASVDTKTVASLTPDITLKDATYVTYINDIYSNPDNYLGKVVQLDGMFTYEDYTSKGGKKYYYVYRQGPGCCGNDGSMCGFEFTAANEADYPDYTPKDGDKFEAHPWIKVTGTLIKYLEGNQTYYSLKDSTIEIVPDSQRGEPIVSL